MEFPKLEKTVIIAMKGLPCTGKSEIGRCIGLWARCPVLYIDHFLDTLSLERGYNTCCSVSDEEAERLYRLAFDALCKVASNYLRWGLDTKHWGYKCVVVKSRLSSTFELDRLVQLARERGCGMILIIEFHTKNEYRVRRRLERKVESGVQKEWHKPRSWKDIDKAMEDDEAADDWEDHLFRLLDNGDESGGLPQVTRLVLDPFDHLILDPPPARFTVGNLQCINFLLGLGAEEDANVGDLLLEDRYFSVQYGEVLRYLAEKSISAASGERRKYLCSTADSQLCVFKYWEELQVDVDDASYCGVCEERVVSSHPAYACVFCTLTLHKSCAELQGLEGFEDIEFMRDYPNQGGEHLPQRHACKQCIQGGKDFSPECFTCLFQTHLKWCVLPTILNHDCHDHFLTVVFSRGCKCMACGTIGHAFAGSYCCYICSVFYDIGCISLVRKVEHEHGGYKHLLKLCYSRDGMGEEESCWCDICYEDMDPQNWFYSCKECPYYAAHPWCVRLSSRFTK